MYGSNITKTIIGKSFNSTHFKKNYTFHIKLKQQSEAVSKTQIKSIVDVYRIKNMLHQSYVISQQMHQGRKSIKYPTQSPNLCEGLMLSVLAHWLEYTPTPTKRGVVDCILF